MSRFAGDSKGRAKTPTVLLRLLFAGTVVFFFLTPPATASAQGHPASLVSKVEVRVDGSTGENLKALISIKQGDPYSLKAVTASIKQLYRTQLFSDIQVLKSGQENVDLTFLLTRRLLVGKISFVGEKGISGRKLREALYSLRPDTPFSEERLSRAQEELKRTLQREGYFQADLGTSVKKKPERAEVEVTFNIGAGKRFVIEKILFGGTQMIPEQSLKRKMKSRRGRTYIPLRLEQDVQKIKDAYAASGYRRAAVELVGEDFNEQDQTVVLSLNITPNEKIEIAILGAAVSPRVVEPIWEEKIFEEWGIAEGEARILSYLRGKGYIFASIASSLEKVDSAIRVVHRVSPGQKYKIQDIQFEGINYYTAEQLKERLGISSRVLFFGRIDGERVFELTSEIRSLYQSQGFPNIQVNLNFFQENNKATAVFFIKEGEQQRTRHVAISGANLVAPDSLLARLSHVEGGPYFPPDIQRDLQKLEGLYLEQGIRGTKIEARTEALGDNLYGVTFEIQEGRKVRIRNLIITGNKVTRKNTILREMRIKEGEIADYELIKASKANLERLGIFSQVKVEEIPLSPEEENLVVTLREGERNYAGIGVGLETRNEPWTAAVLDVDLRMRGTAEFMRGNMLGLGASLSFVSQFSLSEKRAVVSWEQPYFLFNFPIDTYLNAWIEEEDRESFGFEREGVSLSGIRPIFWDLTLLATLRYARTTLTFLDITTKIDRQFYPYSATSISTSFIREKRNDPFNPEHGYFSSLAWEWAFPLFATESDFLKAIFKYQRFFDIISGMRFSSTLRFGLGVGKTPIHERFFAGGSNSFRGEKFDGLGPKDSISNKPVGGKALLLFNFELTFPLISSLDNLAGAVFYDVGNVFYNRSDFDLHDLEHALGLGLRYRTPLGPLRLELGWNLSNPERKGKPLAFITIGHIF